MTEAGVDAVLERAGFSPGMLAKMWSETKVAAFNDLTGHEEAAQALDYPEAMGDYEELRTPKGTPYLRRRATVSAPAEMPY